MSPQAVDGDSPPLPGSDGGEPQKHDSCTPSEGATSGLSRGGVAAAAAASPARRRSRSAVIDDRGATSAAAAALVELEDPEAPNQLDAPDTLNTLDATDLPDARPALRDRPTSLCLKSGEGAAAAASAKALSFGLANPPSQPWLTALPELPALSMAAAGGAPLGTPQVPLFKPQEQAIVTQPPALLLPAVDLQVPTSV